MAQMDLEDVLLGMEKMPASLGMAEKERILLGARTGSRHQNLRSADFSVEYRYWMLRHAPGWPALAAPADAAALLTTPLWLASAHHAALNFAQFPLGAYPPARPALLRRLLPDYPTPAPMPAPASSHTTSSSLRGDWTGDAEMARAELGFTAEVRRAGEEIARWNADPARRNRCGAGVPPYELMAPTSGPGVTYRGVPNSIAIYF
ncbi:probable lipoxygenase 6 [Ananas comosus]|uniref:Probable lipoxygenase 6 n=1 Tax=Ananas comosus TaxID=4615 RepID=A0A6P5GYP5_ANACO|nr:probable lipoxygenase 6 [Ananas comosus]